ncbi:hypothetical protein IW140_001740 [Coemansia sp. RSA 1813]|nr:hypothetical protein IW140_001740 [Coemansia sp. RSA 1813]
MGISAIFKRSKPTVQASDAVPNVTDPRHGARHIKRRTTSSEPSASGKGNSRTDSTSKRLQPDLVVNSQKVASKNTHSAPSIARTPAKNGVLPTPTDSGDDSPLAYSAAAGGNVSRSSFVIPTVAKQSKSVTKPNQAPNAQKPPLDSTIFGLHRLTTPPPDRRSPELRELDPFEESPPRRPLTSFEDPVYIPPLTLATTLVDEYGVAGTPVGNDNRANLSSPTASATPARLSAVTCSTPGIQQNSKSHDFLSEFNATYSYIFGSPPSESILQSQSSAGGHQAAQDHGLLSPSSVTHATTEDKPKSISVSEDEEYETAMGSDEGSSEDEDDSSVGDTSIVHDKEMEEERRKEEERKAAELRSRRREVIKQQVAFERMKERHRRQHPSQQQSSGPHHSVTRWQRESARAVGAIPSLQFAQGVTRNQSVLHASSSTINNRGGHTAGMAQSPTQQPFGGCMAGGQRGDVPGGTIPGSLLHASAHANSSMPNMAAYSLRLLQQQQQQLSQTQQLPQDTAPIQMTADSIGYISGSPQNAHVFNGSYPAMPMPPGPQPQASNIPHESVAIVSPHPVKLASAPRKARNPYLSDSSNDGDDTSSEEGLSNGDSDTTDDLSSIESLDISSDSVKLVVSNKIGHPLSLSAKETTTISHKATPSDSSSDASAKSQSSSKRRVRFHETVSVVFNTRRSIAGEDTECDVYGSDSNSSDASVGLRINHRKEHQVDTQNTLSKPVTRSSTSNRTSSDDAFDGDDALNHARYHIPAYMPAARKQGGAMWLDGEATTVNSSKSTSAVSSRNISPDGTKDRSRRQAHHFKTEPLRDREAEREQREQKRQQKYKKDTKNDAACQEPNATSLEEPDHAATVTIAKAAMKTSSTPYAGATEPANPVIDHVAEARRALLGHYHAPTSSISIGSGIPRSIGTRPAYTSSVKVLGPQSFSRPKKSYSRSGGSATSSEKPVEHARSFIGRQTKVQSQKRTSESQAEDAKLKVADAPKEDPDSSREFELGNVLQNFSIASFEVTNDKNGGMHIHYSDKSNKSGAAATAPSSKHDEENSDDDSDGDELPLSAIVRSRSEPAKYFPFRHSEDSHAYRSFVVKDKHKQEYAHESRPTHSEGNSNSNSPKLSTSLFGRSSTGQSRRVLVRNQSAVKEKTAFAHIAKHEEITRSVSMDGGSRIPPSQLQSESKRRFTRLGAFFA